MIVVVGEPRTGTSLQMLILKNLGFSITGQKYIKEYTKEFNPTGIWEIPGVPYNGIVTPVEGDAIKLMMRGFLRSNHKLFNKMILCIRDPRESIYSQRKQEEYISDEHNLKYYLCYSNIFAQSLKQGVLKYMHVVDYADVMWDPKAEVERLAKFLNAEPTQAAIDCVKPELYRSKKYKIKRDKLMKAAEKYYHAFRRLII